MMKSSRKLDVWQVISFVILALYALFLVLPLFQLLVSSVVNDEGQFTWKFFQRFFGSENYYGTLLFSCPLIRKQSIDRVCASIVPKSAPPPIMGRGAVSCLPMYQINNTNLIRQPFRAATFPSQGKAQRLRITQSFRYMLDSLAICQPKAFPSVGKVDRRRRDG